MPPDINLTKLCERSITKMTDDQVIEHLSVLIDASTDAKFERGANRALYLLDELAKRNIEDKLGADAEYLRANAWSLKTEIAGAKRSWTWERPERQHEILALFARPRIQVFGALDPFARVKF
jgi:hypothetical protein